MRGGRLVGLIWVRFVQTDGPQDDKIQTLESRVSSSRRPLCVVIYLFSYTVYLNRNYEIIELINVQLYIGRLPFLKKQYQ